MKVESREYKSREYGYFDSRPKDRNSYVTVPPDSPRPFAKIILSLFYRLMAHVCSDGEKFKFFKFEKEREKKRKREFIRHTFP